MPAVLPPLFAAEGRGKEGMKVTESLVNPLKRVHFHPTPLSPFTTLRKYLTLQSVVVILGVESEKAKRLLLELYSSHDCPKIITDPGTAELVKHASNSYLAMRISFANMLSDICEALGANIDTLLDGVGKDPRIGSNFMKPGVGFGGSCLPKDIRAFMHIGSKAGVDVSLMKAVEEINFRRPSQLVEKVNQALWVLKDKRVTVWGLSFKPNTNDIRNAASIEVVRSLVDAGAKVTCYDPLAMSDFQSLFPASQQLNYATDLYSSLEGSNSLIVLTEWQDFCQADLTRVREAMELPIVIDGRGIFDSRRMRELGFEYYGFGASTEAELGLLKGVGPQHMRGAQA